MVVGGESLGLLEVVIPPVSSTSPEFEAGPCLASELVSMEVGPLEDMPTVLMAPQLPEGISTSLTLDLNQTCHVEVDVDPVGSVLPCAPTGDETNAYIALNGDPFNFMPIIERTAGKVKGRGRGRPRRVGAVTTSLGVQGVAAPSSKRKRLVEAPLEESSCEHGRSDVPGKRRLRGTLMEDFKQAISDCGLFQFDFTGYKFTWSNKRKDAANVQARLDRGFGNLSLLQQWGNFTSHHLVAYSSDHQPILVASENPQVGTLRLPRGRRRFQFEEAWTTEDECNELDAMECPKVSSSTTEN
ncbi:uncharacterized protein Pyn_00028 [Prunus yedoensis var. nudiflora]|uniref:Endonuclease/exonuclease/phosphatase domain-containing protein n=1 Tax=Prunus yedoensis var. nudiflora TaxID=2094558 RepID=A0A314Z8T2_PRUYE|nr:uncharacterized protein Pyn_00028 [Prunus yedoensis var. nudiflora]